MSITPQLLLEGHIVRSLKNSCWKTQDGYGFGPGRGFGNGSGIGGGSESGFGGRNGIGISMSPSYREYNSDSEGYIVDRNIREQIIYVVDKE